MTNEEFKDAITGIIRLNTLQPERLNTQLGLVLADCGMEPAPWIEYLYEAKEGHLNPYAGVHGGIVSSLTDTCGGYGSVALCGKFVTTTDLSVSFLRGLFGRRFRIRMDYTHVGGRMISVIGKVFDEDSGELCATSMASYMLLDKERGLAN